jgi:hypothetical protein
MGKLLSVIVAGGTGSTGREIVSKLVAHPKVGRVVVLSRYAIPVNRWQTFFPNIRTSDALRHLSIVDVNWHKMYEDTLPIQLQSLIDGGDGDDSDAAVSPTSPQSSPATTSAIPSVLSTASSMYIDDDLRERELDTAGWHRYDADAVSSESARSTSSPLSVATMDTEDELEGLHHHNQSIMNNSGAGGRPDTAHRKLRRTLNALASSTYYRSIFSGHHVAINCLGSHNLLNPWGVNAVDHNFAIAFAKLVRVFNCYLEDRDAEAIADEMEALRESARLLQYDAKMWAEVCAAYLGNTTQRSVEVMTATAPAAVSVDTIDTFLNELSATRRTSSMRSTSTSGGGVGQQRRPTLLHYAQVSAAGASPRSPLPYFSAHGACDDETTRLFCTQPPVERAVGTSDTALSDDTTAATSTLKQVVGHRFVNPLSLDIYKPSLLKRPNARWWEKLLQAFAPPVSVEALSSMIVDDVLKKSDVFFTSNASPTQQAAATASKLSTSSTVTAGAAGAKLVAPPELSSDPASLALLARWQRLLSDGQGTSPAGSVRIVHAKEISWRAQKYELHKQKAASARLDEY